MKISFDWLKDYISVKDLAESAAQSLTMAGLEVEHMTAVSGDTVFATEVTTNRPDWLSHVGVARELHAILGGKFNFPKFENDVERMGKGEYVIHIPAADKEFCPYYSACLLEGVEWGETPGFMKKRLEACGIRSINFPVDVTNYVLLELGQPLHAFSADHLNGKTISARRAKAGEKIAAIDGKVYDLLKDDIVIADEKGPIALAGVMGGKDSEVSSGTKNILLESAFFQPAAVRKTSRRLKLVSESSYRFERRVDPRSVDIARARAIYLFRKYARVSRVSVVYRAGKLPVSEPSVRLELADIKKVLGLEIPPAKVLAYLNRLGLRTKKKSKTSFVFQIPSFRSDLTRSADLIEEVARLYGYNKIPESLPQIVPAKPEENPALKVADDVRDVCTALGLNETVTFSLVDPSVLSRAKFSNEQWVRVVNPQNKELTLMRPTMLESLSRVAKHNLNIGETTVKLFEIGNRYLYSAKGELPREEKVVAIAICGNKASNWLDAKRKFSFYDMKGIAEEFLSAVGCALCEEELYSEPWLEAGMAMKMLCKGENLGFYGAVSGECRKVLDVEEPLFYAEFSLDRLIRHTKKTVAITELPKFPSSPRDLTMIVAENIPAGPMIEKIQSSGRGWIKKVEVFDCFRGGKIPQGKKSLSFRVIYQSDERTLQNQEVNDLHFSIVEILTKTFGAELPQKSSV